MGTYQRFDELPAWQEARELYRSVQSLLRETESSISAVMREQLDRAVINASNHIAEGIERACADDPFVFFAAARGALAEVQSMAAMLEENPDLQGHASTLRGIRVQAETCAMQLNDWDGDDWPFEAASQPKPSEQLAAMLRVLFNPTAPQRVGGD